LWGFSTSLNEEEDGTWQQKTPSKPVCLVLLHTIVSAKKKVKIFGDIDTRRCVRKQRMGQFVHKIAGLSSGGMCTVNHYNSFGSRMERNC